MFTREKYIRQEDARDSKDFPLADFLYRKPMAYCSDSRFLNKFFPADFSAETDIFLVAEDFLKFLQGGTGGKLKVSSGERC